MGKKKIEIEKELTELDMSECPNVASLEIKIIELNTAFASETYKGFTFSINLLAALDSHIPHMEKMEGLLGKRWIDGEADRRGFEQRMASTNRILMRIQQTQRNWDRLNGLDKISDEQLGVAKKAMLTEAKLKRMVYEDSRRSFEPWYTRSTFKKVLHSLAAELAYKDLSYRAEITEENALPNLLEHRLENEVLESTNIGSVQAERIHDLEEQVTTLNTSINQVLHSFLTVTSFEDIQRHVGTFLSQMQASQSSATARTSIRTDYTATGTSPFASPRSTASTTQNQAPRSTSATTQNQTPPPGANIPNIYTRKARR